MPSSGGSGGTAPPSIAVIGAGVAGCTTAALLSRAGWPGSIVLWETGRGPGGRAATRRSRDDALLRLDHGAPLLNITTDPEVTRNVNSGASRDVITDVVGSAPLGGGASRPAQLGSSPWACLIEELVAGGWLEPWQGARARLDVHGNLHPISTDPLGEGLLYRGRGGMEQLCQGLLRLAGSSVNTRFGTLVRDLRPVPGVGWQLLDSDGRVLDQVDWLILSSTLLAHARVQLVLDWETVPLVEAARVLGDVRLDHALASIAALRFEARSNLLLLVPAAHAQPWLDLPFRLLDLDAAAQQRFHLRRIAVQPLPDGRCAVVVHSSATFAAEHVAVYGARSSIARLLSSPSQAEREQEVMEKLSAALEDALGAWPIAPLPQEADRQLMRWAAAFPIGAGLPETLLLCSASRIGFCGDYVSGPGFGRIEGAMTSASRLVEQLLATALDRSVMVG
ncbi:MAG: NAD(P)-binding protein [Cyanobacteriota bacterium]